MLFISRFPGARLAGLSVMALVAPVSATAQTAAPSSGPYVAIEGQGVFGASEFDAGFVPDPLLPVTGRMAKIDEGNGRGGALTLGYAWSNGWRAAVRYRRLEADDRGGPIDPGLIGFAAGVPIAGGFPVPVPQAQMHVDSEASILDLEVATDVPVAGVHLQLFGGLSYAAIDREVSISCACFALLLTNDFEGIGPRIGFRAAVPLSGAVSLVGGGAIAALFGTSEFTSRIQDPLFPAFPFKAEEDRTVAALDGEAGVSFAIGPGHLTLGYRVDAMLGALDTDQRVSAPFVGAGFPVIGERRDDFVEHGPFVRLTLPLAAAAN